MTRSPTLPGHLPDRGLLGAVTEEKINELFSYLQRYQVAAKPDRIFALQDLPAAHAYLASGQSMGKVVIDVSLMTETWDMPRYLLTQKETGNLVFPVSFLLF
ncbi:zinc-binding dehydrogenase [Limosilactobacillus fermentum]